MSNSINLIILIILIVSSFVFNISLLGQTILPFESIGELKDSNTITETLAFTNSNFNQYNSLPNNYRQIDKLEGMFPVSLLGSDFLHLQGFHSDKTAAVPSDIYGAFNNSFDGGGFVALYNYFNFMYVIGNKLSKSLEIGKLYKLSFEIGTPTGGASISGDLLAGDEIVFFGVPKATSIPYASYADPLSAGIGAVELGRLSLEQAAGQWTQRSISFTSTGHYEAIIWSLYQKGNRQIYVAFDNLRIESLPSTPIINAPGSVATQLVYWLKADKGVSERDEQVQQWTNQAPLPLKIEAKANISKGISLVTDAMNFNPVVDFDGSEGIGMSGKFDFEQNKEGATLYVVAQSRFPSNNCCNGLFTQGAGASPSLVYFPSGQYAQDLQSGSTLSTTDAAEESVIIRLEYLDSTYTGSTLSKNGLVGLPHSGGNRKINTNGNFSIGTRNDGDITDRTFNGYISEIILYNNSINKADEAKINTYLALKYGITLDQSIPQNYVNSEGQIIWNYEKAGIFNKNIFGIGKDVASGLAQRISKSENTGTILSVSTSPDFYSSNIVESRKVHSTNLQFLILSDNGATLNPIGNTELGGGFIDRIGREWLISNTHFQQAVNLKFDGFDNQWMVLRKNKDADFSTGAIDNLGSLNAAGELLNITLNDGDFITLVKPHLGMRIAVSQKVPSIIKSNHLSQLRLYPIPVHNFLKIDYQLTKAEIMHFSVFDVLGNQVFTQKQNGFKGNNQFRINMSHHVAGSYFLKIKTETDTKIKKFILK